MNWKPSNRLFAVAILCVTAATAATAAARPQRSSASDVPASFDCAVRKAAYAYGQKLLPRLGAFEPLYYALNLNGEECRESMDNYDYVTNARQLRDSPQLPENAVFVSPQGSDPVDWTSSLVAPSQSRPFRSIPAALKYASQHPIKCIVLRAGVYYLTSPLLLTPDHSHLTILAFPGEEEQVVVSGGVQLQIEKWLPYKVDQHSNIWVTTLKNPPLVFPGLQINGVRSTRARYPNLPGGIEVSCGYGCMIDGQKATWTPPQFDKYGDPIYYTDNTTLHYRPNQGWFENYTVGIHGLCDVYDPPVSYWCSDHNQGGGAFAFRTPSGLTPIDPSVLPNAPYSNLDDAIVFVWRPARWANWMFRVANYDPTTNNITFGAGGNQGARGENQGGDWFIENLLEELDHPNEYFYQKDTHKLYLYYNGTGSPPLNASLVVPQIRTLINITGTQWNPVRNVTLKGLTFRASRYTFMDPHGVPSGGDWALERSAAVFLQGTQNITIDSCIFDRLDSNGLMISGYNRYATVKDSDFSYIGGSAILAWGYTNATQTDPGRPGIKLTDAPAAGVSGIDGEHPRYTHVTGCSAREIGLYEKQASFYMQAKTAYTTIAGNVFFNGPRAGINFNDGFCGGDEIVSNLVFSTCRESGDHGPFNSWDRQPFFTIKDNDEQPSMDMEWRSIHHNMFIDNYSPQEAVDNDDGSRKYKTHHNFLVYGSRGMKNDFGGHDNRHYNNIYAYVGRAMDCSPQQEGHENHFVGNKVVMTGSTLGSFLCQGPGATIVRGNQYYTPSGLIEECKMPLAVWQRLGHDPDSTVTKLPSDNTIIAWAKELLDF